MQFHRRALLLAVIVTGSTPLAATPQTCELTDLGALGQSWSRAQNVSATGIVVGGSPRAADPFPTPFVWRDGSMQPLPSPSGAATGVDSTGRRIVGETGNGATLWIDGVVSPLPSTAAAWSTAAAVNDQGVVVGAAGPGLADALATIWSNGQATLLGALEGDVFSRAWGINAHGTVVGISRNAERRPRAFIYRDGTMRALPTPSGFSNAQASAISDAGLVTGVASDGDSASERAIVWQADGRPQVLGTLGGSISRATGRRAINNRGDVVGESTTPDGTLHGFLWRDGTMVDLNTLLPPGTAAEVTRALAISDNGWIAATARINDAERAVRLRCR
jgi:probable HAF family extracellular repeat protein